VTAGALIIAAGFGRRFGSDKRLFRMRDGTTLLAAALRPYAEVFRNVAVVVRDSDSEVARQLMAEARKPIIVTTRNAERGMGASLADGVRSLADWDYVFIGLGDMPYLKSDTLRQLDARMRAARRDRQPCIVQPFYDGQPGHPVGFSRDFFAALIALEGEEGARSVLRTHGDACVRLDVDDPGVVEDLDQPPE